MVSLLNKIETAEACGGVVTLKVSEAKEVYAAQTSRRETLENLAKAALFLLDQPDYHDRRRALRVAVKKAGF